MGLLGYIKSRGLDKPHGLLACATRVLQDGSGNFASVCVSLGAYHAILLTNRNGTFRAAHGFGLDAETFATSVSSAAWWNGVIGDNGVRTFNRADGTLAACYQLFSSRLRDSITDMVAVSIEPSTVFVGVVLESERVAWRGAVEKDTIKRVVKQYVDNEKKNIAGSALANDVYFRIETALKKGDAVLCRMDVARAVEESLAALAKASCGIMCDVREALYEELLRITRIFFPPPAYCSDNKDGTIRLVLFVNEDFDQGLALFHIQRQLSDVLGIAAEDVDLLDALRAANMDEITAFIG